MWQQLKKKGYLNIVGQQAKSTQKRCYQSINETLHQVKYSEKTNKQIKFKPTFKTVRLKFGYEARDAIVKGIARLSETAAITLGPGGRNVALEYEGGDPKITKDGVTVVKSIVEPIREEDMGARMMKRIAGNTNLYAGDGTTTSTLLANELLKKGFHAVEFAGAHPIALKKGMEKALNVILDFLKDMAMPVSTEKEIFNVCMVSSNYNQEIASIVAKTMTTVGLLGNVNIVESPTGHTRFNLINGLIYERGFVSDAFVTEFKVEQKCELDLPLVLVVTGKIADVKEIMPILDMVKKTKRSFVLFSEDLQQDPMSMMIYNNSKDIVKCCAVNVPWMANVQKEILKDIAIATGATIIDNEYEIKLDQIKLDHFGSAKKIVIDGYNTNIIGGSGSQDKTEQRLNEIQNALLSEKSPHLKQVHRDRYSRMSSKIAEIEVGGRTEAQKGEIRDIIIDSLNSAKSAMMHGMLPGGGVALYQASKILETGLPHLITEESERLGVKVMQEALTKPIRYVISNKTGEDCGHIINKIDQQGDSFFTGYDVKNERIVDMIDAGVVDSFNVIKTILQDAVSLAGLLITTECLVIKEKTYEPMPLSHYQERREFF